MKGRLPPSDLDAEASVISASLLDEDACTESIELLSPRQFFSEPNRLIWEAVCAVHSRGQKVDVTTVVADLRQRGTVERVNVSYLGSVIDHTPAIGHVVDHCKIVWDRWKRRRLIEEAHWVAANGYGETPDSEFLEESDSRWWSVMSTHMDLGKDLKSAKEIACEVADSMRKGGPQGITTGTEALDRTGGMFPGDLIIGAGRPGMGKTSHADCVSLHVAHQGLWVASFSLEMPREQRITRMACAVKRLNVRRARSFKMDPQEEARFMNGLDRVSRLPLHMDDTASTSISTIQSKCRRLARDAERAESKLGLVVIDYLQLLTRRKQGQSMAEAVGDVTRAAKLMARDLNVPVLMLAQLNRSVEQREKKRPMLSDLRDSGRIEEDADTIWFYYRQDYYNEQMGRQERNGEADIIVAKGRNSGTGVVTVNFEAESCRFSDRKSF